MLNLGKSKKISDFAEFTQVKVKQNSLGETGCLGNPYFIYWWPKHPVFFATLTQSVRLPMVTYPSLCSTYVAYRTLCHTIGHYVLPTVTLPREADDFSRGDSYFKYVSPLIYLIYLSPKEIY